MRYQYAMPVAPGEAPPPLLISGAIVGAADGVWSPGWLVAAGGRIQALGPGEAPGGVRAEVSALGVVIDGRGCVLLPGFIDVHVHGGDGADAMDADPDGLRRMARFHATHGVTALLPTTWAAPPAAVEAAVGAIAASVGSVDGGATILGAHLEGPWINPARAGAQDPAGIRPPDVAEARRLMEIRPGVVRLVALAPEMPGAAAVIGECVRRGVTVAAGHTEAGWEEMVAAVRAGVRHVTHTFNAMAGIGHREPGTAGAALALPELRCELIADGHHVHPGAMAVLARAKGPGGVVLISDAVRAAGLPEGDVDLGGRTAQHCCGAVRLPDGRLAGSVLTLDVALRRFAAVTGWGWSDLGRAAAGNAADALGLSAKGRLAAGADADLVLLGDGGAGAVVLTVVEGRIVHRTVHPLPGARPGGESPP
ncbi:MAG: N-acetylglucosamine-6-phosphate deacetylase [Actinomycetota bacterium]|nr:N-acetylglucosamine-6-phosphate deacetylase [Actinomycetota bacterium]